MAKYFYLSDGEKLKSDADIFCVCLRNIEPDVPYQLIKVSVIKTENRYIGSRIDPASIRRAKVKAILNALKDLWKALNK